MSVELAVKALAKSKAEVTRLEEANEDIGVMQDERDMARAVARELCRELARHNPLGGDSLAIGLRIKQHPWLEDE